MQERSTITRNTAEDGGGVFLFATAFLFVNGDSTITENVGGGVWVGEQSTLTLNQNGRIFDNTPYNICFC